MSLKLAANYSYSSENLSEVLSGFFNAAQKLSIALDAVVSPTEKYLVIQTVAQELAEVAQWDKIYEERIKLFAPEPLSTQQATIPVEFREFVGLYGFIKQGQFGHSQVIGVDREVRLYRGILRITNGGPYVMEQAQARSKQQFFGGDKLIVRAGDWFEYEIDHELFYITTFLILSPNTEQQDGQS